MKKVSSYQKMKQKLQAEIDSLRKDLTVMIEQPHSTEATLITSRHNFKKDLEKAIWNTGAPTMSGIKESFSTSSS